MNNGYFQNQPQHTQGMPPGSKELFIIKKEAHWKKRLIIIGIAYLLAAALGIGYIIYETMQGDTVDEAKLEQARKLQYSVDLPLGIRLNNIDHKMDALDFKIDHTYNGDTGKIYIWDTGFEDGDYVQAFADDVPLSEPFLLLYKPRVFEVPTNATVEIKGIRDDGKGINYGIMFSVNEKSYYNYVAEQESNRYRLRQMD